MEVGAEGSPQWACSIVLLTLITGSITSQTVLDLQELLIALVLPRASWANPLLHLSIHQSHMAFPISSGLNWWGQVQCSSFDFHFKRREGLTWHLCAELADQTWVHFNETFYTHCNWAGLIRKLVMGSHPSEWSEATPKSSPAPWPSIPIIKWGHMWRSLKCQYPSRGSKGCLCLCWPSTLHTLANAPLSWGVAQAWVLPLPASGWYFSQSGATVHTLCLLTPSAITGSEVCLRPSGLQWKVRKFKAVIIHCREKNPPLIGEKEAAM